LISARIPPPAAADVAVAHLVFDDALDDLLVFADLIEELEAPLGGAAAQMKAKVLTSATRANLTLRIRLSPSMRENPLPGFTRRRSYHGGGEPRVTFWKRSRKLRMNSGRPGETWVSARAPLRTGMSTATIA
jgi:hypothetical protein